MYMLKCLVSLNNSIVRDVVRYPNNTLPMSFATKESASAMLRNVFLTNR